MRARKRFGQHFLTDPAVQQAIVSAVALRPSDRLLEIGPGRGALTELLYGGCRRFQAIEIDRDLVPLLRVSFPTLEVTQADVLNVDLDALLNDGPYRVVGNLPYNISTPLLGRLFAVSDRIVDLHIMLQQEVAARLCAEPGTKAYGRLSVAAQVRCEVDWLFAVPPESFSPPPAVESAVIALRPKATTLSDDEFNALDDLLRLAFQQRRKRLANALKTLALDWDDLAIDPNLRPDQLSVTDYQALARKLFADGRLGRSQAEDLRR